MLLISRKETGGGRDDVLTYPSKTYPLRPSGRFGRLKDTGDELWDACVKRLSTQCGMFRAYDDTYGIDWEGIRTHQRDWIEATVPTLINECLSHDDRVKSVRVENLKCVDDKLSLTVIINGQYYGEVSYG